MTNQKTCELLKRLFTISSSTGMAAVPSGVVTQDDMDRADAAARESNSITPAYFLKRECYVLSGGDRVQDPKGMQSSALEAVWKYAIINTAALRDMLDKCDELS